MNKIVTLVTMFLVSLVASASSAKMAEEDVQFLALVERWERENAENERVTKALMRQLDEEMADMRATLAEWEKNRKTAEKIRAKEDNLKRVGEEIQIMLSKPVRPATHVALTHCQQTVFLSRLVLQLVEDGLVGGNIERRRVEELISLVMPIEEAAKSALQEARQRTVAK